MAPVFRSSTTKSVGVASTTWPLTKPTGATNGDLLIVVATAAVPTVSLSLSGSGWSSKINDINFLSTFRATVWWKIEDGTTIGTVSWDGSSVLNGGIVMCYQCVDSAYQAIVDGWTAWSTPGAGNPTTPSYYVPQIAGRKYLVIGISDTDMTAAAVTGMVRQSAVNAAAGLDKIPTVAGPQANTVTGATGNNAAMAMSIATPVAAHSKKYLPKFPLRTAA